MTIIEQVRMRRGAVESEGSCWKVKAAAANLQQLRKVFQDTWRNIPVGLYSESL